MFLLVTLAPCLKSTGVASVLLAAQWIIRFAIPYAFTVFQANRYLQIYMYMFICICIYMYIYIFI